MSNHNSGPISKRLSGESPYAYKVILRAFLVQRAFTRASSAGILVGYEGREVKKSVNFICWESLKQSLLFGVLPSSNGSISSQLAKIKSTAESILTKKFPRETESESWISDKEKLRSTADMASSDDLTAHGWKTNKKMIHDFQEERKAMAARIKSWVSLAKAYLDN